MTTNQYDVCLRKSHFSVRIAVAVVAAFSSVVIHAAYNEIGTDFSMSGPADFIAEPGVTNVYTGLISGTGPAVVKGGGTVAFSHANNTYTGGTRVEDAVFRLDADGCAGLGTITAAVDTAHIYMNCANVPNDLYFEKPYAGSQPTSARPGYYPIAGVHPIFPLVSTVTVSGSVYFKEQAHLLTGSRYISRTITFEKDVTIARTGAYLYSYGTTIFNGRLIKPKSSYHSYLGGEWRANGDLVFNSSSNVCSSLEPYDSSANCLFNAPDVLPETFIYFFSFGDAARNIFDVNGNDQTLCGFIWNHGSGTPDALVGEDVGGVRFRTPEGKPASLRVVGFSYVPPASSRPEPYKLKLALSGPLTFVLDVNPVNTGDNGFYQEFADRKSETTGDLIISNGDFRVSGTASFPNVPNIIVSKNGSFTNSSTKDGAFKGCTNLTVFGTMACTSDATPFGGKLNLTLGADSSFSLSAGATAIIASLRVGDTDMPEGSYGDGGTPISQIKQGTVIVRSLDRYVDCVNGSDSNDGAYGRPHKTIRAAIANAVSGNIIHVAPGTYGAEEGSQKWPDGTSEIGTRVVIPDDVTLVSTEGAEKTFIVGAASPDPAVTEGWQTGIGPGAVRCVRAGNGAVLRGFTLTGGYTHIGTASLSDDGKASAFYSTDCKATIEDCIVSNNVSSGHTIYAAVVRRCRVIGNTAASAVVSASSGAAGTSCAWYNSVIANNKGNATVYDAVAFENCTIVGGNIYDEAGHGSQVMFWNDGMDHAIFNSAILDGRYYCLSPGKICLTNCLVMTANVNSDIDVGRSYNMISTNSSAAQVDSSFCPILGSFVGIDMGDATYSTELLGDIDLNGTPRLLNGAIDMGAVEYDWRPAFGRELGRRLAVAYASPSVTTNATGGLLVTDGVVAGKVGLAGKYELSLELTGGILEVYVDGEIAASATVGEPVVRFSVPDTAAEVRIVFTPDVENPGLAILKRLIVTRGFVISFR